MKLLMLLLAATFMGVVARADVSSCSALQSPRELILCASERSRETRIETLRFEETQAQVSSTSQRANPELEAEALPNSHGGASSEISLLHTFELGGKRSARIETAQAEAEIQRKQLVLSKTELAIETLSALYRIRQIETEASLLEESGETFTEVLKTFKRRLRLNPEQEVSLSIYELAAGENELRQTKLEQERRKLTSRLSLLLGIEFRGNPKFLPSMKMNWDPISKATSEGPRFQLLNAEVSRATKGVMIADADAWPDLKIGPKASFESGAINENRFGLALSLPLPIYQRNERGRALAASTLNRARAESDFARAKLISEREQLARTYEDAAQNVKKATGNSKMSQRHKSLHRLLDQGFINASLVIELHRQMYEFQTSLHEQELAGIEALSKIQAIDGTPIGEELK